MKETVSVWGKALGYFLQFHYILGGTALTDCHKAGICCDKKGEFTRVCLHACACMP